MTKYESRIGHIQSSEEKVYSFLSDFNNFREFIPEDQVQDWKSDADSCSFTIGGMGGVGLEIVERNPCSLIKMTGNGMSQVDFFLWIQLKEAGENNTRVKLTMKADLNPMIQMMAAKPLKNFLNMMVDYMENFSFENKENL